MDSTRVTDVLIEQFARTWEVLREIVDTFPESEWRKGDSSYLIMARMAYHIVFAADMYSTRLSYEEYKPKRNFTLDWERATPEELPSQGDIKTFIAKTQQRVEGWLQDLAEDGLLAEEKHYAWTGSRVLSRAVYVLRHNHHHLGELNSELRRRGFLGPEGGKWA